MKSSQTQIRQPADSTDRYRARTDRYRARMGRITSTLMAMSAGALLVILLYAAVDSRADVAHAQDPLRNGVAMPPGMADGNATARGTLAASDLSSAFRNVVDSVRPSVVSISTTVIETIPGRRLPPMFPPEFQQFFGGNERPMRRESTGKGSGVIVRSDGYILTNYHVVEDADRLVVEMFDGEMVEGRLIGSDPQTDLAVVKIERQNLPSIAFGDSDKIRVGDWVLAMGSPFGLNQTVTAGILSGKNRDQDIIDDGRGFEDFLQTDAAINPGNSGGPLVNLRGELVGINTAIVSRSGGNAGIGFAIPVAMARPVLDSIIETGQVRRGFLGASVVDLTKPIRDQFALKANRGAFVANVLRNQPADAAGLKPGDVITQIDGKPVNSGTQVRLFVANRRPGARFPVVIDRDGQVFTTTIELKERTPEAMSAFGTGVVMGAKVVPVTPSSARQYGYPEDQTGLLITAVEDNSEAAEIGLEVGDVLESIDGKRLESADSLSAIFDRAATSGRLLRIIMRRGNQKIMVPIRISSR